MNIKEIMRTLRGIVAILFGKKTSDIGIKSGREIGDKINSLFSVIDMR